MCFQKPRGPTWSHCTFNGAHFRVDHEYCNLLLLFTLLFLPQSGQTVNATASYPSL